MPGGRAATAKAVLVGEYPSEGDFREQEPYASGTPTGKVLDEMLDEGGLGRGAVYIVNAIACVPNEPFRNRELLTAVKCCRPLLHSEIRKVENKPMLVMGELSLLGLDGTKKPIGALRGFIDADWRLNAARDDQVGKKVEAGGGVGRGELE